MFGFDQTDHHDLRVGSLVTDVAAAVDQPAFASSEGDCTGLSESFSAEVLGDILARAVAVTQAPHSPLVAERWNNVPLVV